MRRKHPLIQASIAWVCLGSGGFAADVVEHAPPAQGVNAQVQIQGGVQLQIQGGGRVQFNMGGVVLQAAGNAVVAPQSGQPPFVFVPGFPFHPLPNPAVFGSGKPGYLGVLLVDDPEAGDAENQKFNGVGIGNVVEGSPAEKAGLKVDDRVFKLDGKVPETSTQLREMIRSHRPGQEVKLVVKRDGKDVEIKATLAAAPEVPQMVQVFGGDAAQAVPGIVFFNPGSVRSPSGVFGSASKNASGGMDAVSLRDGNRFLGKIKGIDPEKGVTLQREGFPDMDLIAEEISVLSFAELEKIAATPAKVHLQLRDGSWVGGDSLTMEHGVLLLTLPGGQRMEIPRGDVQSASLSNERAPQIYDGPTGLAGWSSGAGNEGRWEYKDGFLSCVNNGLISRNFERMPDPLDMSFDVTYPPQLHHFSLSIFGTGVNQNGPGSLSLQFSPHQIFGQHFDGRRSNQYSVPIQVRENLIDNRPQTVRYRLLVDCVNGRALIYIDGTKRADWKLSKVKPEDIGKSGAYFSLSPNVFSSDHQMRLGRIRLLPWDGKEPANGAEPAAAKADQILVQDGPGIDGTIESITDEEIVVAGSPGVPRQGRTFYLLFAAPAASREQPAAVAILRIKNGSQFAVTQIRGAGDSMTLTTGFGSQITLPLSVLREINFLRRPGQPDPVADGLEVLTFTDGTQVKGRVVLPVEGERLLWKIAASKTPLEFPGTRVAGIFFARAKNDEEAPMLRGSSAVRLGNGDWFPGDVASMDDRRLVMKTDLAPEMILPLAEVRGLYLSPDVIASVADGATGRGLWTDGWNPNRATLSRQPAAGAVKSEQTWLYHDGGYAPTGANRGGNTMLARKWPAYVGAYAVNLEITNPGRSSSFQFQLFNPKGERTFTMYCLGGRVVVYFNPATARLNRFAGGGKKFEVDAGVEPSGGNVQATVVVDRPGKALRVLMSGKEIGKIPFKESEATEALDVGGIALSPLSSGQVNGRQNRIVSIWLAPWEGPGTAAPTAPTRKEEGAADAGQKQDSPPMPTIYLANGDEFAGSIEKISTGMMNVISDAGPLELPSGRVAWISFPGAVAGDGRHFPRLRFHNSGLLSVKDLQLENGRVKCRTMQGQALDFPLSLVKELIYRSLEEK